MCKNVHHTSSNLVTVCYSLQNAGIKRICVISFFTCMPWVMFQCLPVSRISEVFYRTAADPDSTRRAVFVRCRPLVQRCLATGATVASFRLHVDLMESVLLHVTASAVNCRLSCCRVHVFIARARLSPFTSLNQNVSYVQVPKKKKKKTCFKWNSSVMMSLNYHRLPYSHCAKITAARHGVA